MLVTDDGNETDEREEHPENIDEGIVEMSARIVTERSEVHP